MNNLSKCLICPRMCGANRASGEIGCCGAGENMRIARAGLHMWEEPSISGTRGSGAVFFCGCPLGCVFCQNIEISRGGCVGNEVSTEGFCEIMLKLRDGGAHNINLVSPTQYTPQIISALEKVKSSLGIPVIWNTGGYERPETIKMLDGLIDVYLPDIKYFSAELSEKYSAAPDYFVCTDHSLREMYRQVGGTQFGCDGMVTHGIIVRHLVLPSHRHDSLNIIKYIAAAFPKRDVYVSIMRQFTPNGSTGFPELERRPTSFEYQSVVDCAAELGLHGYTQEAEKTGIKYLPDFGGNLNCDVIQ